MDFMYVLGILACANLEQLTLMPMWQRQNLDCEKMREHLNNLVDPIPPFEKLFYLKIDNAVPQPLFDYLISSKHSRKDLHLQFHRAIDNGLFTSASCLGASR